MNNNVRLRTSKELLSGWQTGSAAEGQMSFDPNDVPEQVQDLIPYAKIWGIPDDGYRHDLIEATPKELSHHLVEVLDAWEERVTKWLAGPEADRPDPTDAYVAFSAFFIAADYIKVVLTKARQR